MVVEIDQALVLDVLFLLSYCSSPSSICLSSSSTWKDSCLLTPDGPALPLGPVHLGFFTAGVGVVGMMLQLPVSESGEHRSTSLILCAFGVFHWLITGTSAIVASTQDLYGHTSHTRHDQ